MQGETIEDPTAKDAAAHDPFVLDAIALDRTAAQDPMTQDSLAPDAMDEEPAVPGPTSQELEQLLAAARERLDVLVSALRAVDAELEGLAPERMQHRALQSFCSAFDQLNEAGAAALFWGDRQPALYHAERLRAARGRCACARPTPGPVPARDPGWEPGIPVPLRRAAQGEFGSTRGDDSTAQTGS